MGGATLECPHLGVPRSAVINVGGDQGWVAQVFEPIEATTGDILNFTSGRVALGRFVAAQMGGEDSYNACKFAAPGVRVLGYRALVNLTAPGVLYFASPGLKGSICRLGMMKLIVTVKPGPYRSLPLRLSHPIPCGSLSPQPLCVALSPTLGVRGFPCRLTAPARLLVLCLVGPRVWFGALKGQPLVPLSFALACSCAFQTLGRRAAAAAAAAPAPAPAAAPPVNEAPGTAQAPLNESPFLAAPGISLTGLWGAAQVRAQTGLGKTGRTGGGCGGCAPVSHGRIS